MRVNNDFRRAYSAMEQSNRQLQQVVNQLERIDRTKSDFISVASHELRTPLTLIRGYTEMLLEEQSIRGNDFQSKTVDGIYSGILRLQEILESMLDVASIDSRSFSLSKQPVSISQLIRSLHKKLKPVLEERNLRLTVENLSFLPVIEADGTALNKVFSNLINNAIKYTPDGGSITISGVLVSPGQMNFPNGGVEVIIADKGIGIDPENLTLIFNKFYQAGQVSLHSSGKTKYRGSGPGLGLAIAKGIIEAHGGIIWAESKGFNDQTFPGSQFYVVLPISKTS
jgi:signal transduction histidine kinase